MTGVLVMVGFIVYNVDMSDEEITYPEPPPGIRVLKNGAGYDMTTKKIAAAPGTYGPGAPHINKENSKELRELSHKRTQNAIREAIVEQMKETGAESVRGPESAIGYAAGVLYREAVNPSTKTALRDRNQTVWHIARAADLLPDNRPQMQQGLPNMQINLGSDVIDAIIRATGGQIIDITPEE